MDYLEVSVLNLAGFDPGIVIAQLAEMGFESFEEHPTGVRAYIREDLFRQEPVLDYLQGLKDDHDATCSILKIEDRNWNEIWESHYEPVLIAGKCCVRAPFHQPMKEAEFDIVIEPRMSFGTAHHETTSLMLGMLMGEEVAGKRVLDMGCGTGVLAILAHRMKAGSVTAIDNDEWAYANALDNMVKNHAAGVVVIRGDAGEIPRHPFGIVLANINRNVLLADIPAYASRLEEGGVLLLSGFYEEDLPQIASAADAAGLKYSNHHVCNRWTAARFTK